MSPNQPRTPVRGLRVSDAEWEAFQAAAKQRGESASAAARRLFAAYVRGEDGLPDPGEGDVGP